MSAKKMSSLEKLQQQANQARSGNTATGDMDGIFDDLLAQATPPKPTRVAVAPVTPQHPVEKEAAAAPDEPTPADAERTLPETDAAHPEPFTKAEAHDSPTGTGEGNFFVQNWTAFQAHKFFNFLVRHGNSIEGQSFSQPLIARFSGVSLPTVKQLASKMTKLGIITSEPAPGNKRSVVYRPVEKYARQFMEVYGDSFPKNKTAYKAFHEARLKKLLKID